MYQKLKELFSEKKDVIIYINGREISGRIIQLESDFLEIASTGGNNYIFDMKSVLGFSWVDR